MKKTMKVVATSALALSLAACSGSGVKEGTTLTVDANKVAGFFAEGFGNVDEDLQVKKLLYKAGTVYTSPDGEIKVNNTIVKKIDEKVGDDGNKTYTITINDGLKWSDGSEITAADYVFGALYQLSDEFAAKGAAYVTDSAVLGDEAYKEGVLFENYEKFKEETKDLNPETDSAKISEIRSKYGEKEGDNGYHKGWKLIDDHTFAVTVKKEFLPYFYELLYVNYEPLPMNAIAPGAKIVSDENGTAITGVNLDNVAAEYVKPEGYLHKPTVVSGPYTFVSNVNNEVVLEANPNYNGNYEGKKPTIKRVVIKGNTNTHLDADRLMKGEVNIVPSILEKDKIEKLAAKGDRFVGVKKDRLGYGVFSMGFDAGITKDENIRHALAHLINRKDLISDLFGEGNAVIVNGQYSLAQWMYKEAKSELAEELKPYDFSTDLAKEALDKTDYKYQADGKTPWTEGSGYRFNSKGEELVIKHFSTESNPVSDFLKSGVTESGRKVGLKFDITTGDWPALMKQYYGWYSIPKKDRYNSFNLAAGFTAAFDPTLSSVTAVANTTENSLNVSDPKLDELAYKMRKLDKSQRDEYLKIWIEYQKRYNEILPLVPLYSNISRDYYDSDVVESLPVTSFLQWSDVIEYVNIK